MLNLLPWRRQRPKVVHKQVRGHDEPILVLEDGDGMRSLHFGRGAVQSRMAVDDPSRLVLTYTQAMMATLLFAPPPRSALLIGLGGGSLARFLHHHFADCTVHAVEPDADVVRVARDWFMLPGDARLTLSQTTGETFMASAPTDRHDLLLIDAYEADGPARAIESETFFTACRERLAPGGVLTINLWDNPPEYARRPLDLLESCFDGRLLRLPVEGKGNLIAFAFRDHLPDLASRDHDHTAALLANATGLPLKQLLNRLRQHNPRRRLSLSG